MGKVMTLTGRKSARGCWSATALACCAGASAWADPVTIADIAPKASVVVMGCDDSAALGASFDASGFRTLWDDAGVQAWFKKHSAEGLGQFDDAMKSLGLTKEDLKRPTGPTGLAAWLTGSLPDPETGEAPPPSVIMLADYGEETGAMHQTIVGAMERARDQKKLTLKESDHNGSDIYTYTFVEGAPEGGEGEEGGEAMMSESPFEYPAMHYAQAGTSLLISSDEEALHAAIDRVKGDKLESVESSQTFQSALKQLGGSQAYAVMLAGPGLDWFKQMMEAEGELGAGGPGATFMQMLDPLGVEAIQALSLGLRLDSDQAMLEQTYAALIPTKKGLVQLLDVPAVAFEPPAFVGADVMSVTLMQFDFAGLIPLLNRVVAGLPQDQQDQMGPMLMMGTQMLGPLLANLGPQVYLVNTMERPLSATSQKMLGVIKTKDAAALGQALTANLAQVGFEARDFQGNQLWTPGAGGMLPPGEIALGLGFGYLFVGPLTDVENAMRQAGAPQGPRLSADVAFTRAIKPLAPQAIAYAYQDIEQSMEWADWMARNMDKITRQQFEAQWGGNPPADDEERQFREQMLKEMESNSPAWMKDLPSLMLVPKHVGDMSSDLRSTPEGFVGRYFILAPAK